MLKSLLKNLSCLLKELFFRPTSEEEVLSIINRLKTKTSSGPDELSSDTLKKIKLDILRPLTFLINALLEDGLFPDFWKLAKLIPLFKGGDATDSQNYRPISLLSILGKVFEYVILDRLVNFFDKHKILSPNQFGFRKGRSTVDAVSRLVEQIYDALENKEFVITTFLDLSKAFDCVNRSILLDILERHGVRGTPYQLLESYLSNRQQFVSINTTDGVFQSDPLSTTHGVPQGSILGPFLFLVYINHLVDNTTYADDTSSLAHNSDLVSAEVDANTTANSLTQSFADLNLLVNPKKTGAILFKPSKKETPFQPSISINSEEIQFASSFKVLGITLDANLSWKTHIDLLSKKIASGLFILKRIIQIADRPTALSVYYSLIQSHMTYGIAVWGSCGSVELNRIFKLQKRAVRLLAGLNSRSSCIEAFPSLGILTVPSLYVLEVCSMLKKNPSLSKKINDFHSYNTRNAHILEIPKHSTSRFESKPSFAGSRIFNQLPPDVRMAGSTIFRKSLKKFLLSITLYSLSDLPHLAQQIQINN